MLLVWMKFEWNQANNLLRISFEAESLSFTKNHKAHTKIIDFYKKQCISNENTFCKTQGNRLCESTQQQGLE